MREQLNRVCRAYNKDYGATLVSWNDNARTQGSVWGSNITDARLKGKDGQDFLVVRPSNFNERIGKVRAKDLALIVGNHTQPSGTSTLTPTTLDDFLKNFGTYGSYAQSAPASSSRIDLSSSSNSRASLTSTPKRVFYKEPAEEQVGIRFQAVFLPVQDSTKEFYPDTYNYQTRSWEDPKNIVVLCTSQGSFVQQDGPGSIPQYIHQYELGTGTWRNKYLEAKMTRHGVSMGQQETTAERNEALKQGKAISTVIGTRSMGHGFNRLMTIQIPLKQQKPTALEFCSLKNASLEPLSAQSLQEASWSSDASVLDPWY